LKQRHFGSSRALLGVRLGVLKEKRCEVAGKLQGFDDAGKVRGLVVAELDKPVDFSTLEAVITRRGKLLPGCSQIQCRIPEVM
jgi:hypothetical protein